MDVMSDSQPIGKWDLMFMQYHEKGQRIDFKQNRQQINHL